MLALQGPAEPSLGEQRDRLCPGGVDRLDDLSGGEGCATGAGLRDDQTPTEHDSHGEDGSERWRPATHFEFGLVSNASTTFS